MKLFGTVKGVFVPSYEAILGAVLFLILPRLVGGIGLVQALMVVILAHTVTLATSFSISDCATNLERIGAGGMYAVARRSLGMSFGGSIGIQLFIAQAASIGFYAIAFSSPLQEIFSRFDFFHELLDTIPGYSDLSLKIVNPEELIKAQILMQQQIIGTAIALIACTAGLIGADFVVKIQSVIFVILTLSVASILAAPLFGFENGGLPIFAKGINFRGFGLIEDGKPILFWGAFALFFPAVTGIDAGVGMSGNLKYPKKSLPAGTFAAIGVTFIVYIIAVLIFSLVRPELLMDVKGVKQTAVNVFSEVPMIPVLITAGILFATGSSALSYFLTAPRTGQSLARDRILPGFLNFLKRDFSKKGSEPRWATVLTLFIVVFVIWLGDVEFSSTVVGICFLVVYGWINLAAFFERISGNPSFRPTSKGHWLISLYGFLSCMMAILLFNYRIGIVVFATQFIIFFFLLKFKSNNRLEGVWWGLLFSSLNWGFRKMKRIIQGTKNWRPIVGLFCFADKKEESIKAFEIGRKISSYKGLIMTNILKPEKCQSVTYKIPADAKIIESVNDNYDNTITSIIQAAVPGGLQMNTALLPLDTRINLVDLIEKIMGAGKNVLLYRDGKIRNSEKSSIDVWWKGEENGNLMALLSYIIQSSYIQGGERKANIRIIRKLSREENVPEAEEEMDKLMKGARLGGEVLVLSDDGKDIHTTIREISGDASLILIGMPGKRTGGIAKIFSLDKILFTKELEKFVGFPPLLFVKAAKTVNLLE